MVCMYGIYYVYGTTTRSVSCNVTHLAQSIEINVLCLQRSFYEALDLPM